MTDLTCSRCGIETSYADASIADMRKTCEQTRKIDGRRYTVSAKHEWEELDE